MKIQLFLIAVCVAAAAIGVAIITWQLRRDRWLPLGVMTLLLYGAVVYNTPGGSALRAIIGIGLAAIAGCLLGSRLGNPASLLAFFVTAAVVDTYSTISGPTRALLSSSSDAERRLLEVLAVIVPLAGRRFAVIGLPDLLGATALFTGLRMTNVRQAAAAAAPIIAIAAALAIALAWRPLPVFPFLALAALAATAGWFNGAPRNASDPPPNPSLQRTPPG